jgi:hypothetical protein
VKLIAEHGDAFMHFREAEAEGLWVWGQPVIHWDLVSETKMTATKTSLILPFLEGFWEDKVR